MNHINIYIYANHITKHTKSLKIILILTTLNEHYNLSYKISPFPLLHAIGVLTTNTLRRGSRFLQPASILPSRNPSLQQAGVGSQQAVFGQALRGASGQKDLATPASCHIPLPYRRWPGRGSMLGLCRATLPAANRNLQQC